MMERRNNPIRVLVVEDREEDFHFLSHVFRQVRSTAYQIEWVTSYEAGLAALRRGGQEVGIFDYSLGQNTGIELLQAAKAMGSTMPILLLTGHDSPEIDQAALHAGAVDFLSKSGLDQVQLERAIRYALHQAAMHAKLQQSQKQLDLFMSSVPCAVAIRSEEGSVIFQNELHARFFRLEKPEAGVEPGASTGSPEPRACVSGDRHWFVNKFDMVGTDQRRLHGFTALDVTERVQAENERRRTTQLLDSIIRVLPVIVGRVDAGGRVTEATGRGLAHAGLQPDTLTGRVFAELYPPAAEAVREALAGKSASFTLSGRKREVEWHAEFFMMFDAAQGKGATFFGRDISEHRQLERRLLTISDEEQQRIGADLHDGLGQQLTGLSCLAAALRDRLAQVRPEEAAQAELISRLANEAVAQSRALAHGLCPVQLENTGLLLALEELAGQAGILHGAKCRFEVKGPPPNCDHLTALHLYRITQEAVHNAVRHGQARHISIALVSRRNQHRLVISDDGVGFDTATHGCAPSGGLRLMSYRATVIGGVLSVDTRPRAGTRINCHFTTFENNHEIEHSRTSLGAKSLKIAC